MSSIHGGWVSGWLVPLLAVPLLSTTSPVHRGQGRGGSGFNTPAARPSAPCSLLAPSPAGGPSETECPTNGALMLFGQATPPAHLARALGRSEPHPASLVCIPTASPEDIPSGIMCGSSPEAIPSRMTGSFHLGGVGIENALLGISPALPRDCTADKLRISKGPHQVAPVIPLVHGRGSPTEAGATRNPATNAGVPKGDR